MVVKWLIKMQPRGPLRAPFSIINTALHCSGKYSPVVSCTHHIVLWQPGLRAHKTPQAPHNCLCGRGEILINMYSVEKEYNALGTINTSQSKSSPPGSCYPDCQSQCSPTPCYNWYTLVPCGDRHCALTHCADWRKAYSSPLKTGGQLWNSNQHAVS